MLLEQGATWNRPSKCGKILWYTIGFSNSSAATQRQMNFSRWFCIYFRYSPQFHNNSFSALGLQCLVSVMQKQFTLQSHHCKKGIEFYQTQRNWRSLSEIILSKKPKYFPNSPTTTCDWFSICLFVSRNLICRLGSAVPAPFKIILAMLVLPHPL